MTTTPMAAADSVAILGLAATHGGTSLGVLSEFGFTPNIETTDIYSVANGKRELLRRVVTQVVLTMTMTTLSVLDPDVIDKFAGGAGGALTFEASEGPLVITRRNAESGRSGVVIDIDNAALRGTGMVGTPGSEASGYQFEAVALLAGDAVDLGQIATAAAPTGLRNRAIQQAVKDGNVKTTETIDLGNLSIDDAKKKIADGIITASDMLAVEQAGKNRDSFVPWLERRVAQDKAAAASAAQPEAQQDNAAAETAVPSESQQTNTQDATPAT